MLWNKIRKRPCDPQDYTNTRAGDTFTRPLDLKSPPADLAQIPARNFGNFYLHFFFTIHKYWCLKKWDFNPQKLTICFVFKVVY